MQPTNLSFSSSLHSACYSSHASDIPLVVDSEITHFFFLYFIFDSTYLHHLGSISHPFSSRAEVVCYEAFTGGKSGDGRREFIDLGVECMYCPYALLVLYLVRV